MGKRVDLITSMSEPQFRDIGDRWVDINFSPAV